MDYTQYSIKRDKAIKRVCDSYEVKFKPYEDILLNPVGTVRTGGDKIYTKFTPYFNNAKKKTVKKSQSNNGTNYYRGNIVGQFKGNIHKFYKKNENIAVHGGRINALKILKNIKTFKSYNKKRNILHLSTTRLSAYIKFGCVSIREVYHIFKQKLGTRNDLIKQLYWRDFYYNVGYGYPHIYYGYKNLKTQYNKIKWDNNPSYLRKWKEGKTGFPIVDAAMREMNETGFMHNRGRLIVSNFLIKNSVSRLAKKEKNIFAKLWLMTILLLICVIGHGGLELVLIHNHILDILILGCKVKNSTLNVCISKNGSQNYKTFQMIIFMNGSIIMKIIKLIIHNRLLIIKKESNIL